MLPCPLLYEAGTHGPSLSKLPPTNAVCLNGGTGMLICLLVDFNPITPEMAPGAIWHPYHVLSALCNVICLGRWLKLEIQLSRLIRLGLRVHNRGLDCAIHKQCYPVTTRLQSRDSIRTSAPFIGSPFASLTNP